VQKVLTRKKNLVKIVLKRIAKNQSEFKCQNSIRKNLKWRQNFKREYRQLDNVFKFYFKHYQIFYVIQFVCVKKWFDQRLLV